MTKEEKKAIEISKISLCVAHKYDKRNMIYNTASLETLLNLLDKQQKEIERLKNAEEYSKLGKETLLDTIHKQQKEIEIHEETENDYEHEIKRYEEKIEELKDINSSLLRQRNNIDIPKLEDFYKNYISKDKVREILFDIGTLHDGGYIKVKIIRERLEGLLEE